jgi:pilus assembly protein Flp/PilA
MIAMIRRFVHDEEGQDLVEYAMLIALIALTVVGAVTGLANAIGAQYGAISTSSPLTAS